jgi:hypothetical protein
MGNLEVGSWPPRYRALYIHETRPSDFSCAAVHVFNAKMQRCKGAKMQSRKDAGKAFADIRRSSCDACRHIPQNRYSLAILPHFKQSRGSRRSLGQRPIRLTAVLEYEPTN